MWSLLIRINKNLITAIPVVMILGFLFGLSQDKEIISSLKGLIIPFTFLMVYPMMVTMNIKHLFEGTKNIKLQLTTQGINFLVIPFIAYGLGRVFFADQPYMALGLLLAALLPTSGMTISWTGFARGNMGAAINMTVVGLVLGSLAAPFYVKFLIGTQVDMDISLVVKQILFIVFIPMILGFVTRQALLKKYAMREFKKRIAPRFPALSTIGVLGIVFVALALKAKTIAHSPALLGEIFVPLLIIYAVNFAFSTMIGKTMFSRGDGIALVYGTVMRNLSIALAIAINAFGVEGANAALVIAMSYIIQVQSAAWYVKFSDRIFGTVESAASPDISPVKTQVGQKCP